VTEYTEPPSYAPMAVVAHGLAASSYDDPACATAGGIAITSGTTQATFLNVYKAIAVTNLYCVISAAGVTLTAGQNLVGLYSLDGQRQLGVTTDQSAAWTSTGKVVMPFAGGVVPVVPAGGCWAVLLSVGTTPPTVRSAVASAVGIIAFGQGSIITTGTLAAGQTVLPTTFNPATIAGISQRLVIGAT
jgi:hypothetical protein